MEPPPPPSRSQIRTSVSLRRKTPECSLTDVTSTVASHTLPPPLPAQLSSQAAHGRGAHPPPSGRQTGSVKEESGLGNLTTFHLAPQFKEILQFLVIARSASALVRGRAAVCSKPRRRSVLRMHVRRVKWLKVSDF